MKPLCNADYAIIKYTQPAPYYIYKTNNGPAVGKFPARNRQLSNYIYLCVVHTKLCSSYSVGFLTTEILIAKNASASHMYIFT